MLRKYLYIYISLIGISVYPLNGEGVDVPSAQDLRKLLHETCHERLCLIKKADTNTNYFSKIMNSHQKIKQLEFHNGFKHLQYKQDLSQECTGIKCQIMRLYNQLNRNTLKLAEILKPYNQELIELNEKIYLLRDQLKTFHNIEEELFTLYTNMLFL